MTSNSSTRKFDRFVSVELRQRILDIVVLAAERIEPIETVQECRDPKDDKHLAAAAAGINAALRKHLWGE